MPDRDPATVAQPLAAVSLNARTLVHASWSSGGESPRDLQRRALAFVDSLSVPEAVVVTHAGVIRTLLAHWQGLPPERWTELNFAYGSRTVWHVSR